jgi:hypothetical protein
LLLGLVLANDEDAACTSSTKTNLGARAETDLEVALAMIERLPLNMLEKTSGTAVLVLGGAHDLSDNVPQGVRLIVLTVKGYSDPSLASSSYSDSAPSNSESSATSSLFQDCHGERSGVAVCEASFESDSSATPVSIGVWPRGASTSHCVLGGGVSLLRMDFNPRILPAEYQLPAEPFRTFDSAEIFPCFASCISCDCVNGPSGFPRFRI